MKKHIITLTILLVLSITAVVFAANGISGKASYPEFEVVDNAFAGTSIHAADVDGDTHLDIIASGSGEVAWWENVNGDGSAWVKHVAESGIPNPRSVYGIDMDGDNDIDMVSAATGDNAIRWHKNVDGLGTEWETTIVGTNFPLAFWVHAADVNGDNNLDIIGGALGGSNVFWYDNVNGDGSEWTANPLPPFPTVVGVHGVDMDDDDDIDIIAAGYAQGQVVWFENLNGDGGLWEVNLVDSTFSGAVSVIPTDMDHDGDIDIMGASNISEEFAWFENQGLMWVKHQVGSGFANAESVWGSDFDGDGDTDIVGAVQNDNQVVWFENLNGDGSVWREVILGSDFTQALAVFAADLDMDNDDDLMAVILEDEQLLWWENQGGQFALETTDIAPQRTDSGELTPLLEIVATHNGEAGDDSAELTSIMLDFEIDSCGAPATFSLYRDDGDGMFDAVQDSPVNVVNDFLGGNLFELLLADNDPLAGFAVDAPVTYFVAGEFSLPVPARDECIVQVAHVEGSSAENQATDEVLTREFSADVSTKFIVLNSSPPLAVSLQNSTATTHNATNIVLLALTLLALMMLCHCIIVWRNEQKYL